VCFDCAADLTEAEQWDARWRGTVCTECAGAALALLDELRGGPAPDSADLLDGGLSAPLKARALS
jgi:hypothetical protein